MSTRMIQRRGTYQEWFDTNPLLGAGEIGFESDTGKFKIGNGSTNWNDLGYFVNQDQVTIMTQDYATEQYVDTAVGNVTVDLSTAAGANIDWNATTSQFDAVIPSATPTAQGTVYGKTSSGSTDSVALGYNALNVNTGISNVAIGNLALQLNTTGEENTAIGYNALQANTTGSYNVALGTGALYSQIGGTQNIAIGGSALALNISGEGNAAVGTNTLNQSTGHSNSALGGGALQNLDTGDSNVAIGSYAGSTLDSGSNNIIIGTDAEPSADPVSNEITLGNSSITKFRIPGLGIDWTSATKPSAASWNYIGSVSSTSGSSVAFSSLNGEYKELFMTFSAVIQSGKDYPIFRINGDSNSSNYEMMATRTNGGTTYNLHPIFTNGFPTLDIAFYNSNGFLHIKNANSTGYKGASLSYNGMISSYITGTYIYDLNGIYSGGYLGSSAVSSINISLSGGSFSSGYWKLWGLK